MGLKARLNRLEAAARWLRYDGRLLVYERRLELLEAQRHYEKVIAQKRLAEERDEAERQRIAALDAEYEAKRAAREAEPRPRIATEPVPPPIESPPPPVVPGSDHTDIPEHMQIRPVTWRFRGPEDWEDDDGHDPYQALTEYDPLAECDC